MFLSNRVLHANKCLSQTFRYGIRVNQLTATQAFYFSAEETQQETPAPVVEEVKVESAPASETENPSSSGPQKVTTSSEWGITYDENSLKLETEWQGIAHKIQAEQMEFLEAELSDLQKKKVDMLADKVADFEIAENRYFQALIHQKVLKSSGINLMKMNMDWPSLKLDGKGSWPPNDPDWFKKQGLDSVLGPVMGQMGGGAQQAAPQGDSGADAAPAEDAAPKEKTHYDIELTKFDPATKIKVIKEIRSMFGLGLKEAKETVEGAPVWLKKEVAKDEAEALAEKLSGVGAEIRLA